MVPSALIGAENTFFKWCYHSSLKSQNILSVYLFNLAGYSLWFQHLISQSDSKFVKQLDNNRYNEAELIEVKVPLNMPYINNTTTYKRVDGRLEHNGVHYNYVKRKVSNDTLYILCLPNVSKPHLCNAKAAYGKEVNDILSNKKAWIKRPCGFLMIKSIRMILSALRRGLLKNRYNTISKSQT